MTSAPSFARYFTNEELDHWLFRWAQEYPHLVHLSELGESYEGRPIRLLTLTNRETGPDTDKPAVWIDANIHATEVAGTTTALRIAYELLRGYGHDPRCTRILDRGAFYIVPRLNPDGAALALADRPRYIRSGTRPYPFEEPQEGLHVEDMDGDGRILQMRIPDPNGDWKVSAHDPRLMERRGPDDQDGPFYRLFPEGRLERFDGYILRMAPPLQGLDFNRNFPFEWKPENEQPGAGPFPTSEKEIRAVAEFITTHKNINLALTYHTYSGVILRPYSTRPDDQMETDDLWVYQRLGERGTDLTGYPCISVYHGFRYHPKRVTAGAFDDWCYDHLGIFAFTVELWDLPGRAGIQGRDFIEWHRKHPIEDDLKIVRWLDEHVGPDGLVAWYPFDHPQLGPVELGGFNTMYTWRNPPPAFMEDEANRNVPFALALGDMLPGLAIHTLELTPLGDDRYRLRLVVENTGFLPTHTSVQGEKRQAARGVQVRLDLPGTVTLVSGRDRVDLGHLKGRSHRLYVTSAGASSPTDNRAWTEWVLQGPPGETIHLHVESDRAGRLHRTLVTG